MVEPQSSKLITRVRFPSSPPVGYPQFMWIALPVEINPPYFKKSWAVSNTDFFRSTTSISRSFSVYVRPGRKVTESFRLINMSHNILDGYLYSLQGIGSVVLLKTKLSALKTLVRPNVKSTRDLLNELGLIPNAKLVTETVVFTASNSHSKIFRFHVSSTNSDDFVDDELFPRFIAALVIERMILDLAVETLNSKFVSSRTARKLKSNIRFWISRPAIESLELREKFQLLRTKLDSENRTREIFEALDELVKRGNASFLAGTATSAGLLALTDTPTIVATQGPWWVLTSIVVGFITWLAVRGLRI